MESDRLRRRSSAPLIGGQRPDTWVGHGKRIEEKKKKKNGKFYLNEKKKLSFTKKNSLLWSLNTNSFRAYQVALKWHRLDVITRTGSVPTLGSAHFFKIGEFIPMVPPIFKRFQFSPCAPMLPLCDVVSSRIIVALKRHRLGNRFIFF